MSYVENRRNAATPAELGRVGRVAPQRVLWGVVGGKICSATQGEWDHYNGDKPVPDPYRNRSDIAFLADLRATKTDYGNEVIVDAVYRDLEEVEGPGMRC